MSRLLPALCLTLSATALHAQDVPNLEAAASQAVSELQDVAKNRLMVSNILGSEVKGPSGQVFGTVDDLVVIPGGRIVVALIKPNDGSDTVPVPFTAVKVAGAATKASVMLSQSLSEIQASDATKQLQNMLGL